MGKRKHSEATNGDVTAETADTTAEEQPSGVGEPSAVDYDTLCLFVNQIAKPLASRKLARKVYKIVKRAAKQKHYLRQGIAEVQRALRKGETGVVVLAGNVTPVDVYAHIPGVCEEKEIPYVFTPSKEDLGHAAGHKRPSVMMLVKRNDEYAELFDEVKDAVEKLPLPI